MIQSGSGAVRAGSGLLQRDESSHTRVFPCELRPDPLDQSDERFASPFRAAVRFSRLDDQIPRTLKKCSPGRLIQILPGGGDREVVCRNKSPDFFRQRREIPITGIGSFVRDSQTATGQRQRRVCYERSLTHPFD